MSVHSPLLSAPLSTSFQEDRKDRRRMTRYVLAAHGYQRSDRQFNALERIAFFQIGKVWPYLKFEIVHRFLSRSLSHRIKKCIPFDFRFSNIRRSTLMKCFMKMYVEEPGNLKYRPLGERIRSILSCFFNPYLLELQERRSVERSIDEIATRISRDFSLLDTRLFPSIKEFKSRLHHYLRKGKNVEIIDVETSIWHSIFNGLSVDPEVYGDSCCSFTVIKNNFLETRKNRRRFIQEATSNCQVSYTAYLQDIKGRFKLIAEKREHLDKVYNTSFLKYLKVPLENEIDRIAHTLITENLIYSPFIPLEKRHLLERWKGFSIKEALESHVAHGLPRYTSCPILPTPFLFIPVESAVFYYSQDQEVSEELAYSPKRYRIFHQLCDYSLNKGRENRPKIKGIKKKIIDFLDCRRQLEEINITEKNALLILEITKLVDLSLRKNSPDGSPYRRSDRTTYPIRQRILKVSKEVTTCQVFTNTLLSQNFLDLSYLMQQQNWVNERVALHAKLIIHHSICSRSLSQKIKPKVVAIRGNTGVGKSFWVMHHIKDSLEDNEQLMEGVLNPDSIKGILKRIPSKALLNRQVYAEGRVVFEKYLKTLANQILMKGVIIDTRLLNIEEFEEVLSFSLLRNVKLELIDIEAPVWISVISVLGRDPKGNDPCVTFDVIKDGFMRARQNRKEFIYASQRENVNYSLYRIEMDGKRSLVAENRDNNFMRCDRPFEECLEVPLEEEINLIAQSQITKELIAQLNVPINKQHILMKWQGYTVEEALERHSQGEAPLKG